MVRKAVWRIARLWEKKKRRRSGQRKNEDDDVTKGKSEWMRLKWWRFVTLIIIFSTVANQNSICIIILIIILKYYKCLRYSSLQTTSFLTKATIQTTSRPSTIEHDIIRSCKPQLNATTTGVRSDKCKRATEIIFFSDWDFIFIKISESLISISVSHIHISSDRNLDKLYAFCQNADVMATYMLAFEYCSTDFLCSLQYQHSSFP